MYKLQKVKMIRMSGRSDVTGKSQVPKEYRKPPCLLTNLMHDFKALLPRLIKTTVGNWPYILK